LCRDWETTRQNSVLIMHRTGSRHTVCQPAFKSARASKRSRVGAIKVSLRLFRQLWFPSVPSDSGARAGWSRFQLGLMSALERPHEKNHINTKVGRQLARLDCAAGCLSRQIKGPSLKLLAGLPSFWRCVCNMNQVYFCNANTRGGGTLSLVFLICICIVEPGRRNSFVQAPRMSLSLYESWIWSILQQQRMKRAYARSLISHLHEA
jgi:hypothetical protein